MIITKENHGVYGTWSSEDDIARWTCQYFFQNNPNNEVIVAERRKKALLAEFAAKNVLIPEVQIINGSDPDQAFDPANPGVLVVSTMFIPVVETRMLQGFPALRQPPMTYEQVVTVLTENFITLGIGAVRNAYASAMFEPRR